MTAVSQGGLKHLLGLPQLRVINMEAVEPGAAKPHKSRAPSAPRKKRRKAASELALDIVLTPLYWGSVAWRKLTRNK